MTTNADSTRMRLVTLTNLGLALTELATKGAVTLTASDAITAIERGTIFDALSARIGHDLPLTVLERDGLLEEWNGLANAYGRMGL